MTIKNFSVKNGLTAGNITLNATTSAISTSGNITVGNANLGNTATANYFVGDGGLLSNINITAGSSITNGNSNVAVSENSNITVSVSGNANIAVFSGTGINIAGYTTITGNLTAANASLGNLVIANYFSGSGANLTAIAGANVTGTVANATFATTAGSVDSIAGANVTGQVANALVASTVYTNAQPNITSVGTLTSVSISGNTTSGNISTTGTLNAADAIITGNLTVQGNTSYINVETLVVEDPLIEMGGGPNGSALTTNDGKDRGSLLHYYTTAPIDAFMGWDNSNAEFAFGSNVTVASDVVTFNSLGNIRAGNANLGNAVTANFFVGDGSLLTGISTGNTNSIANGNSNVTVAANSNVTVSVAGTANVVIFESTGINVAGNLTVGAKSNLGPASNVIITGGSANALLSTDGLGNLSWQTRPTLLGTTDPFTGDGAATTFTLSVTPSSKDLTMVNIDGVLQLKTSYSLTGNVIGISPAPLTGVNIEVTTLALGW